MPNIDECKVWIEKARQVLGGGRRVAERNTEISGLLTSMEKMLNGDRQSYKTLTSNKDHTDALLRFGNLKSQFEGLAIKAKEAQTNGDEKQFAKVGKELRALKRQARLEIGKIDPVANDRVKSEALKSARFEPVYADRRKKLVEAGKQLESMPGTKEAQQKILENLTEAEQLLKSTSDFKFASEKLLHPGALKKLMQEAQQSSENLPESLFDKSFAVNCQSIKDTIGQLAEVGRLSHAKEVDDFEAEMKKLLAEAEKKKNSAKNESEVNNLKQEYKQATDNLLMRITVLKNKLTKERGGMTGAKMVADTKWNNKQGDLQSSQKTRLAIELEKAESLESCQLYAEAEKAYDSFSDNIDAALKIAEEAPQKWKEAAKGIVSMEETVKEANKFKEFNELAFEVGSAIAKARKQADQFQDFPAACELLANAKKMADELKKVVEERKKNGGDTPPVLEFPDPYRTVEVHIKSLESAAENVAKSIKDGPIADLEKEGGNGLKRTKLVDSLFLQLQAHCRNEEKKFEKEYREITDPNAKKPFLDKFLLELTQFQSNIVAKLKKAGVEAKNIKENPNRLAKSKQNVVKLKKNDATLKAIQAAQRLVDQLLSFKVSTDKVKNAVGELKQLLNDHNGGTDVSARVATLTDELKQEKKTFDEGVEERQKKAEEAKQKLLKQLDQVANEINNDKVLTKLRIDVNAAAGMMASKVATVNQQGEQRLTDLEDIIKNIGTTIKKDLQKVHDKKSSIKEKIKELKSLDKVAHARVDDDYQTLLQAIDKMPPDEALKELTKFETEKLVPAKGKGDKKSEELGIFFKAATALRKKMENSKLEQTAPELYKQLKKRRDMAKLSAPGNVTSATTELHEIELLMETAQDDETLRTNLNDDAKQQEFDDERRKEEYLAAKALFNTNYKAAAIKAKKSRPDDYTGMCKLVKQADKAADATPPDFMGAKQSLEQAIELAKYLIDNDTDDTAPIGRSLSKLNASWKSRVGTYLNQVATLTSDLEHAGNLPVGAKDVHDALDPLLGLFNAKGFDKHVEHLTNSKPKDDINAHRKLKEDFLTRIRTYQNRLQSNKVLKYVAANKISKVLTKPLQDTLQGMQAEVLGS